MDGFREELRECTDKAEAGFVNKQNNFLFFRLRQAFVRGDLSHLIQETKAAFITWTVGKRAKGQDATNQSKLADFRYPFEWYPATRAMQRVIHLHVGPTNSGKTYHALQKLEAAKTGIYAGPLRLLAHEVYTRMNAKGKKCALVTGEEKRLPEGMTDLMSSCTVEMVPLNSKVEVAVIDEIQMLADSDRGWAWTQAFLGVQAQEVHLCGELRTIELVKSLCAGLGEKLIIHRYERLSPLEMEAKSLRGNLKNLQKGDAIILFSRVAIHAMKTDVEKITGKRCAVVYGSLPPETRAQQAALFNDPNNDYDFLVASDAVGMGLNLSIKRVIFEATSKHDGVGFRMIQPSEIKQIAGRAGRYKSAHEAVNDHSQDSKYSKDFRGAEGTAAIEEASPLQLLLAEAAGPKLDLVKRPNTNKGFITTLENFDLPIVQKAMKIEVEPIKSAGIFPPADIIMKFARYFPAGTPFSYIILRIHELAIMDDKFHICRLKEQLEISDAIQDYPLTVQDRLIFMSAPVSMKDLGFKAVLREFAHCIAMQSGGELLDIESLNLELLEMQPTAHHAGSMGYLREAESLHKQLTLYLWLSYRFAGVFRSQALAFHVKSLIEAKIDECLADVSWSTQKRKEAIAARRKVLEMQEKYAEEARIAQEQEATEPKEELSPSKLGEAKEADGSEADEYFQDRTASFGDSKEETESDIDADSMEDVDVDELDPATINQNSRTEEELLKSRRLEETIRAKKQLRSRTTLNELQLSDSISSLEKAKPDLEATNEPQINTELLLENTKALADQTTVDESAEKADDLIDVPHSEHTVPIPPPMSAKG